MRIVFGFLMAGILCVGCATTEATTQSQLSAPAERTSASEPTSASESNATAEPQAEKQSLNELLEENDRVELVDDETGKTKLICKRQRVLGSRLGSNKVCATRKQWDEDKRRAQQNVDQTQRGLATPPPSGN